MLFDEPPGLRRSDLCEACQQKQSAGEARSRAGFISHWQGLYEAPPPLVDPIQKDTAETLLRKLIEQNDPRYAPAGYILAVMLERKRVLKVKEQIVTDGKRVFIYEQPGTGDVFTIADPESASGPTRSRPARRGGAAGTWFESATTSGSSFRRRKRRCTRNCAAQSADVMKLRTSNIQTSTPINREQASNVERPGVRKLRHSAFEVRGSRFPE